MKRIVTVQDISCLGKCSLTVALPIISAMGVECCVLPTAVLSTHTLFSGFTFRDLTEDIPGILDHWEEEKFRFDAIYTGYLGSQRQLDMVAELFDRFDGLNIIDPVMGDHGRLYTGFTPEFAKAMAKLCAKADLILPNLTEAAFLLDEPYMEQYDRAHIEQTLRKLVGLGAKCAVLTGVSFEAGTVGFMGYDAEKNEFFEYFNEKVDAAYHGTGDIFASTAVGALMRGLSCKKALALAADYTRECIRITKCAAVDPGYGVYFEQALPLLMQKLEEEV